MPCSALFQGYIRTMSLGPTTTNSLAFLKTQNKIMPFKPSFLLGFVLRQRSHSNRSIGFCNVYGPPRHLGCRDFMCLASSGAVEVDGRQRQRSAAATLPFWQQQQSLNYGRYAYQDVSSSEDSDNEFGSSRQQMVSFWLPIFLGTANLRNGINFVMHILVYMYISAKHSMNIGIQKLTKCFWDWSSIHFLYIFSLLVSC